MIGINIYNSPYSNHWLSIWTVYIKPATEKQKGQKKKGLEETASFILWKRKSLELQFERL